LNISITIYKHSIYSVTIAYEPNNVAYSA